MGLSPPPYEQGFSLSLAIALETKVLSSDIDLWLYNTVEAHLLRNFIIIILVEWLCVLQIMMMMMINGISQKET